MLSIPSRRPDIVLLSAFHIPRAIIIRDRFVASSLGRQACAKGSFKFRTANISTDVSQNLPSEEERKKSQLTKSVSEKLDNWQVALFTASRRLNDLTGYSGIERLKQEIEDQEREAAATRQRVLKAKEAYKHSIARRASSQKEVNELLQRKHAWTASDLERFTTLYRSDHANEQEESQAHNDLANAERESDEASALLSRTILVRYHEEQIWSDKIRRASTWGTWAIMGTNLVLFIVVQLGLEPWKRRRLVGNFEEKVRTIISEQSLKALPAEIHGTRINPVAGDDAQSTEDHTSQAPVFSEQETVDYQVGNERLEQNEAKDGEKRWFNITNPSTRNAYDALKHSVRDMFAEGEVKYRKVDISILVVESMAAGALISIAMMRLLR